MPLQPIALDKGRDFVPGAIRFATPVLDHSKGFGHADLVMA
jgi:hypothetical protein